MMASIWYSKLKTTENKMKKGPASINGMRIIWGYFWFPIGKKNKRNHFSALFFQGNQNGKTKFSIFFQKFFFGTPTKIFLGKENVWDFFKNLVLVYWLPWKINQKNGLACFFTYGETKNIPKCSSCHRPLRMGLNKGTLDGSTLWILPS